MSVRDQREHLFSKLNSTCKGFRLNYPHYVLSVACWTP